jgi:hypothetical protein
MPKILDKDLSLDFWCSCPYFEVQLCFAPVIWTLWFALTYSQVNGILPLIFAYLPLFLALNRGKITVTCEYLRVKSHYSSKKGYEHKCQHHVIWSKERLYLIGHIIHIKSHIPMSINQISSPHDEWPINEKQILFTYQHCYVRWHI